METMLYDYILYEKTDDIVLQKKKNISIAYQSCPILSLVLVVVFVCR